MEKNTIKSLVLILVTLFAGQGSVSAQQNIQFTQYMFNTLSINPAYAGYKEDWFVQTALRNQWVGIKGAPETAQFSVDGILDPYTKRLGLGVQVTADKLAAQTASSGYINLAYRLRMNEEDTKRLSFGMGFGLTQYGINGNLLKPIDDRDNALPLGKIGNFIPDIRLGAYYYTSNWYMGMSVMDLLSGYKANSLFRWEDGTVSNIKRKRHIYLITGFLMDLSYDLKLRPSLLVKEDFRGPTATDLNAMLIFNNQFWIGGTYRTGINIWKKEYEQQQDLDRSNAIAAVAQFYVTEALRIGYSYDYSLNRLQKYNSGSHEVTLGITIKNKLNRDLSPRFF